MYQISNCDNAKAAHVQDKSTHDLNTIQSHVVHDNRAKNDMYEHVVHENCAKNRYVWGFLEKVARPIVGHHRL